MKANRRLSIPTPDCRPEIGTLKSPLVSAMQYIGKWRRWFEVGVPAGRANKSMHERSLVAIECQHSPFGIDKNKFKLATNLPRTT